MGLQGFERRLERLVEGTFAKAFRSGLQPVEIGRKMVRELDAHRTLGVRGTVIPNQVTVYLATEDFDRFESFADVLVGELAEAAREHAREEGYHFIGPVAVELVENQALKRGDLAFESAIKEGVGGRAGTLVAPDGTRIELHEDAVIIGRLPECAIAIDDPRVSRHHAEIRPDVGGYVLHDLGSTNGTLVNGVSVKERLLNDGDHIDVGSTVIRFEAS